MWPAIVVAVVIVFGLLLLVNYIATRATLRPPRTPFFLTPRDVGLSYQNVGVPLARRDTAFGLHKGGHSPCLVSVDFGVSFRRSLQLEADDA